MGRCFNNSCLQKLFYLFVNDNHLSCIKVIFSGNHGVLSIGNKLNFDSFYRTEYTMVRSYGLPNRNKLSQFTSNINRAVASMRQTEALASVIFA